MLAGGVVPVYHDAEMTFGIGAGHMADFAILRRKMVDNQLRTSNVTDRRVLAAMGDVPRERFVPDGRRELAYADLAHPLGGGRALGAPAPFAKLLQLAEIAPGDRILDVGAGTGYSTAVLSRLGGQATALEPDAQLAAAARDNLASLGVTNAAVIEAGLDGAVLEPRSFDVIIVDGALESEPAGLLRLLADGGRLVTLLRRGPAASARIYQRRGDDIGERSEFNTTLPPLAAERASDAFVF